MWHELRHNYLRFDHHAGLGLADCEPSKIKNVSRWIAEGTFKAQQSVTKGIDNAVDGLLGMLKGENFGKAILTIEEMET